MQSLMDVRRFFPAALLLTACFLSGAGCGGSEKVVKVTGKVTRNDQPVPGIVLSFVPQAVTDTGVSTGTTDDSGEYKLSVAKTGKSGAVVGTHKVWVSLPRTLSKPPNKEETLKAGGKPKKKGPATGEKPPAELTAILKKYGNLDKSPLKVDVIGSGPIDLKLD
jgi:hypothetical protein